MISSARPEAELSNNRTSSTVGTRATFERQQRLGLERPALIFPPQVWLTLGVLLVVFLSIGGLYGWALISHSQASWFAPLMTALWTLAVASTLLLLYWMWSEFVLFGNDLAQWTARLRHGDLTVRMPVSRLGCPSLQIREQINAITDDYQALARMQQQRLQRQEKFIAQKNHHLSVLYDVATCINRSNSVEELFDRLLNTLRSVLNAEAVAVRLFDEQGEMKLVASVGIDDEIAALETRLPRPDCVCALAASQSGILVREDMRQCGLIIGKPLFECESDIEMLAIPLQYRDKILGVYNLFVSRKQFSRLQEEHELLTSIGQHLGMAIEKASVDEEALRLSIMEERTRMAHELHDSLAQTLASLRFKARLLDDTLNKGDESVIWQELEGLENTIDEAYAELRSLITHFRAPLDGKGVVRAVEKIAERFRIETQMEVFFYHNWNLPDLDSETELEVVRMVQEALANVRKHSHAQTVRILMYSSEEGRCSILVEDDGVGLPEELPKLDPLTGEHIGLHIMQERAEKIGGDVQFESDPEEGGTLVQISFHAPPTRKLSEMVSCASIGTPIATPFAKPIQLHPQSQPSRERL